MHKPESLQENETHSLGFYNTNGLLSLGQKTRISINKQVIQ